MTTTLTRVVRLTAQDLRPGDVLLCRDGSTRTVLDTRIKGTRVWVEVHEDQRPWPVPLTRPVNVRGDEHCDECSGTGSYAGRGKHFACEGKGYQTREDRVRNTAYWNLNGGRA